MKDKAEKKKLSFRETIRIAWKPYRRLYSYVLPYKWRFFLGLFLGFLFGATNGVLPLVMGQVTGAIFHGATPNAKTQCRRIDKFDFLHLPAHSGSDDRAQHSQLRQHLLHELGQ